MLEKMMPLMPPMFDANGDLNALFLLLVWIAIIVVVNLASTVLFRDRDKDTIDVKLARRNKRVWAAMVTIPLPLVLLMLVCFVPLLILCMVLPRVVLAVVAFFEQVLRKDEPASA